MNSKIKNIIILVVALALSGLIILWINVINKGTLIVTAEPPFAVNISPMQGTYECMQNQCSYKIKPGEYTVTVNKSGYFEAEKKTKIFIFKDTAIKFNMNKIPQLKKLEEINYPEIPENILNTKHNLEYKTPFLKAKGLNRIIDESRSFKQINKITVSNFGEKFLIEGGTGKVYLYDTKGNEAHKELHELRNTDYNWGFSDKYIYFAKDDENKQRIYRLNVNSGKTELLTTFLKKIDNIEFFASPDDSYVIIAEINRNGHLGISDNTNKQIDVYLLDTNELRKEKIMTVKDMRGFKWSLNSDYGIYQLTSLTDDMPIVYIYDRKNNSSIKTRIPVGIGVIEWIKNNEFAFNSNVLIENYLKQEDINSFSIFYEKFKLASDGINVLDQDIVLSYNIDKDEWKNITTNSQDVLRITDLRVSKDFKTLFIVSENTLYGLDLN